MVRAGRVLLAVLVVGMAAAGSASAASSMSWSSPVATGAEMLRGVSCPSESFCAAVGSDRQSAAVVYTSTDPADGDFRRSAAFPANVDLVAISCPSVSLCVAVGDDPSDQAQAHTVVAVSTHPTAGAGAWRVEQIDTRPATCGVNGRKYPCNLLASISCPSVSLCVAVDWSGEVVTSTDPSGPGSTWNISRPLYGTYEQCDYTTSLVVTCHKTNGQSALSNVSCPSVSFCLAGDFGGNVFSSIVPTAGAGGWYDEEINSTAVASLSCASASLCVVGDYSGDVLASTDPARGPSAWSTTSVARGGLDSASCPSVAFCVMTGSAVLSSTSPTGGRSAWTTTTVEPNRDVTLYSVSCASIYQCVATDSSGNVLIGTSGGVPASAAASALRKALAHSCAGERVARVRRQHGCATPFTAPGPGAVTISWLGPHNTKLASGALQTASAGRAIVPVRLTRGGNGLLSHARRKLHIKVIATFTDLPGHAYTQAGRLTMRR